MGGVKCRGGRSMARQADYLFKVIGYPKLGSRKKFTMKHQFQKKRWAESEHKASIKLSRKDPKQTDDQKPFKY